MRERHRIEPIGDATQERGDAPQRVRGRAQTLGGLLLAELTGVIVGDDEDVERVAGEHRYLRVAAGITL
jgi:hypothetical protein